MTDRPTAPLEDSFLGIDLTEAHARRREEFLPFEERKRIRHERFLASQQREQEQAQKAQTEKAKPSVDAIKAALSKATPKELETIQAFIGELEATDFESNFDAEEDDDETAPIEELE
jgi:hypothetical protein